MAVSNTHTGWGFRQNGGRDGNTDQSLYYEGQELLRFTASELNLLSGKTYQIAGTNVLSNNTLGSGVTASSLTSVGVLASPVLTTPQINDTSADHQYVFAVSELSADRTVTLPQLTGNDTFVFAVHAATLTNKTFDANGTGNSLSNVDVADLANGTDGELITWDANAAPATVAVGTSSHVLTSNGAGAAPTFQASGAVSLVTALQGFVEGSVKKGFSAPETVFRSGERNENASVTERGRLACGRVGLTSNSL